MNTKFHRIVENIHARDTRYSTGVYEFIMQALSYSQKKFKKDKNVTAEELLVGIKELLIETFGPMTMTVLKHWGVKNTEDFGNIVFNLVEDKILSRSEEDDIEKFRDGYDFNEVFNLGYRKALHRKISRMK